ncbi:ATP-binding domain-containing protein [[Phormidium] sp. ETS-05]|uniref:ATP-binding domain-containing protein n=1 Tax=[Phormidium] sp. ETS-05 TaxID=222819 RepID=UPI0018EEE2D2|nr:ATP-binding domain-containing protein [[Phormidium] sp. ETS-05]
MSSVYSIDSARAQIRSFIESSAQILVVTGMIGTGIEQLLRYIVEQALYLGRNYSVLGPNRRIASRYPVDNAESIYTQIYSRNPRFDKEKFVYDLTEQRKADEKHLYVMGDAHLISDSKFETDNAIYGSGKLLTDFLEFAGIQNSKRQIIWLGDPFQLTRGKADESALCTERLQGLTGLPVQTVSLQYILPGNEDDLFVDNCLNLAKSMESVRFNELGITTDGIRCIEAPNEPLSQQQIFHNFFTKEPRLTKFVCFSHVQVNHLNEWVRKNIFSRGEAITVGDIVHIHNSLSVYPENELDYPIYVPNDSFAEVIAVSDDVPPIVQPLKGRDRPINVPFLRIRSRLLTDSREIGFFCLKNYLYAEKPELDTDTIIAIQVSVKTRFRQQQKQRGLESDDNSDDSQFAMFLRRDPYFNAARLRFGYALTLHRAQGQQFRAVIADMDTGQGQTNEAYFRWVYTLFSIVQERIILWNIPIITPFSQAVWDNSQGRLDSIRPRNLIPFDPDAAGGSLNISGFSIPEKPLRNLYLYIEDCLKYQKIHVILYKHHNYQEIYGFESEDGASSCNLRLHYNGKFQVTRIEIIDSSPAEFAHQIHQAITSVELGRWDTEFQQQLYELMKAKLSKYKISIQAIEHHDYQEVYYLRSEIGDVKLQMFFDGDGFIKRVIPVGYSTVQAAEAVRNALELPSST